MGQASGIITKDDLQKYGGANIMLLDGTNEVTDSSGSASGSIGWALRWDSQGFTGSGHWDFLSGYDFEQMYQNGTLESFLNDSDNTMIGFYTAINVGTRGYVSCAS